MEIRLIPEFNGDSTQNVVEWLEKAELVCNLRGIAHLESVIYRFGSLVALSPSISNSLTRPSGTVERSRKHCEPPLLSIHLQHNCL